MRSALPGAGAADMTAAAAAVRPWREHEVGAACELQVVGREAAKRVGEADKPCPGANGLKHEGPSRKRICPPHSQTACRFPAAVVVL